MRIGQIQMNQTKALPPVPQFNWSQMESSLHTALRAERRQAMGSLIWDLLKAGWSKRMIRAVDPRFFTLRGTKS